MSKKKKYFRLPKKFAEKWFETLLSGEYLQGNGQLCNLDYEDNSEYTYCCLGVALACFTPEEKRENFARDLEIKGEGFIVPSVIEVPKEIPDELIQSKVGAMLTRTDGGYNNDGEIVKEGTQEKYSLDAILAMLNDGTSKQFKELPIEAHKSYSFKEIVDWIKENVELY